jgi:hypothetical protein
MKFSNGVVAKITFKETLAHRGYVMICTDSREIYDSLVDRFGHDVAASAEGWTELASVGEWYEEDEFEIEMMEA